MIDYLHIVLKSKGDLDFVEAYDISDDIDVPVDFADTAEKLANIFLANGVDIVDMQIVGENIHKGMDLIEDAVIIYRDMMNAALEETYHLAGSLE